MNLASSTSSKSQESSPKLPDFSPKSLGTSRLKTDLDKASTQQLNRGKRLVEVLKQGLHEPLPVEKQVLLIYAATNGFLDDLPVSDCRKFESELYRFVENAHPQLLATIREKKDIDADLKKLIESVLKEFKARFLSAKG